MDILDELVKKGNSVIIVQHDPADGVNEDNIIAQGVHQRS